MAQRIDFRARALGWLTTHLRWLDEMGSQLNLTRSYGRAAPGVRVVEGVPAAYGNNYTLLASLGLDGVQAPWLLAGALDGDAWRTYVAEVLERVLKVPSG